MSEAFEQVKQFADKSFCDHVLTERLNDGLFRSYRCQKPGTWCYGFDVTFTPGWVHLYGDIGHISLCREADMFPWLRAVLLKGQIDLRYVDEKCPHCIVNREWSEWGANRLLDSIFESDDESDEKEIDEDSRESLRRHAASGQYEWETLAIPELLDLGVHDFYEYGDAKDWTSNFCWSAMALKRCVELIDAMQPAVC